MSQRPSVSPALRIALREVLEEFLSDRPSGETAVVDPSRPAYTEADLLFTEMLAQARRGHSRFCVGIHTHDDGQTEEEWVDWEIALRRLISLHTHSELPHPSKGTER